MLRWLVPILVLLELVYCQDAGCPFHPCTPEQLGCPSSRLLMNKRGCLLCRCEETTLQNRPCSLHGCTVKLLNCNGTLRKDEKGCDLCECSNPEANEANVTVSTMQRNPMMDILDPSQVGTGDLFESTCPPLDPPCTLECKRAVDPRTRCEECRCAEITSGGGGGLGLNMGILDGVREDVDTNHTALETQDPCPDPMEMVESESSMVLGRNGRRKSKYKLQLKKLKKGFKPGKTYKIIIKGSNRNPFKAFLLDLKPAPEAAASATRGRKRKANRGGVATETTAANCGVGVFNSSNVVRVAMDCPTAAIEGNTSNKTKTIVKWTAPPCGCVHIRAAVVDYTDRVVYMDDVTASPSGRRGSAQGGKVNKALWKTVCSKKKSRRPPGPKVKGPPRKTKGLKVVGECCRAAIIYGTISKKRKAATDGCEQQATLFTMGRFRYNRYKVLQRTCKTSYRQCCESFIFIHGQPNVGKPPKDRSGSTRKISVPIYNLILQMLESAHRPDEKSKTHRNNARMQRIRGGGSGNRGSAST